MGDEKKDEDAVWRHGIYAFVSPVNLHTASTILKTQLLTITITIGFIVTVFFTWRLLAPPPRLLPVVKVPG